MHRLPHIYNPRKAWDQAQFEEFDPYVAPEDVPGLDEMFSLANQTLDNTSNMRDLVYVSLFRRCAKAAGHFAFAGLEALGSSASPLTLMGHYPTRRGNPYPSVDETNI